MSFAQLVVLFVGVALGHTLIRTVFNRRSVRVVPCQQEAYKFGQCVELSSVDVAKCQVYMNILTQCQSRHPGHF